MNLGQESRAALPLVEVQGADLCHPVLLLTEAGGAALEPHMGEGVVGVDWSEWSEIL